MSTDDCTVIQVKVDNETGAFTPLGYQNNRVDFQIVSVFMNTIINVLQKYESEYAHGNLEQTLNSHWAEYVPIVYKAKVDVDTANEERKANKFLLRPLEQFICNGNPDFVFKQLKEYDKPSHLCGRSFKNGEPTYSCRYEVAAIFQCNEHGPCMNTVGERQKNFDEEPNMGVLLY